MLGPGYISDLKDEYTDDVEEGYTAELIVVRFVFFFKDFDYCSDEIDVVGFIIVSIPNFSPDYTVWVLMILSMLIIRCKDILDSIMTENILIVVCDFGIC